MPDRNPLKTHQICQSKKRNPIKFDWPVGVKTSVKLQKSIEFFGKTSAGHGKGSANENEVSSNDKVCWDRRENDEFPAA